MRGKGRDQQGAKSGGSANTGPHVFPSPCGEKVGINFSVVCVGIVVTIVLFQSPCGEKVGINAFLSRRPVVKAEPAFPSPCGEKVGIN